MADKPVFERMHADSGGVQGPNPGGLPWLNSAGEVEKIVRAFAADFVRRYGVVSHADFMGWLEPECARMNALFIGPGLDSMPYDRGPWNTPDHLGQHITLAMGLDTELRSAVRDAFMVFAADLGKVIRDHQNPASLNKLKAELDARTTVFAKQLLGLDDLDQ